MSYKDSADKLTPKQRELYLLMSEISEDCYCAGWMHGNEFRLWDAVTDAADPLHYGMSEIAREDVDRLRALHEEIGGWIEWCDDSDGLPLGEWGPYFIPTAAWLHKVGKSKR